MTIPAFSRVGHVTLTILRYPQGSYVNGRWQKSTTPTEIDIEANVQPHLTSKELSLLAEGDRTKDVLKVYTTYTLRGRKEGANPQDGDQFVWVDGETYEVVVAHTYIMGVLDHTKAICVRKELT